LEERTDWENSQECAVAREQVKEHSVEREGDAKCRARFLTQTWEGGVRGGFWKSTRVSPAIKARSIWLEKKGRPSKKKIANLKEGGQTKKLCVS